MASRFGDAPLDEQVATTDVFTSRNHFDRYPQWLGRAFGVSAIKCLDGLSETVANNQSKI